MKDFFARQEAARRRTRRLLTLFALAVLGIVVCIYLVVRLLYLWHRLEGPDGPDPTLWDPAMFIGIGLATVLVILAGSLYKIRELRRGGCRVAEMLGGRLIAGATEVPEERRLLNVVEEMAIASGVPVPDVYVLDRERGINAFAAGFGLDDAVICVTRGSLALLSRDELQGVIAHEFSHLFNGDTLINIRLMGWLHGILVISLVGEGMVRGLGRTRSRSGGAVIVVGFALYLLGYLGVFLGNLIKSAVSRQREYLADAAAVQFTRNPAGLAGALKKVGGLVGEGRIGHHRVTEASHMYFCNGLGSSWLGALATHPPLLERICHLEPRFDGIFPTVEALAVPEPPPAPVKGRIVPPAEPVRVVSAAAAAAILASVGTPMQAHAQAARTLIAGLPEGLLEAARELDGACALVLGLLLDRDVRIRERQLDLLARRQASPGLLSRTEELLPLLRDLPARVRLPLVDLALPALRHLSAEQYRTFREAVDELSLADGRHSLFEFALCQLLTRHLESRFEPPLRQAVQIYAVRGVAWECSCVLSLLARVGHRGDESQARKAFDHGARILQEPRFAPEFLPVDECAPSRLGRALKTLGMTSPPVKRKLLAACLECLAFDGEIRVEEVELFRAVAESLGVPIPPWLGAAAVEEDSVGL